MLNISSQLNFKWLGDGWKKGRKTHYSSFSLNNMVVNKEDYVLIYNDETIDSNDFINSFVAQVQDLYEAENEPDPHRAKVQWFSRIKEFSSRFYKILPNIDNLNEVIEDKRAIWKNIIDAETIFHKCLVITIPYDADLNKYLSNKKNGDNPVFFCRYIFNGAKFLPKKESETKKLSTISKNITNFYTDIYSSKKNEEYSITPLGDSKHLKVILKRLDSHVLESANKTVKINDANSSLSSVEVKCFQKKIIKNNDHTNNSSICKKTIDHSLILKDSKNSSKIHQIDSLATKQETELNFHHHLYTRGEDIDNNDFVKVTNNKRTSSIKNTLKYSSPKKRITCSKNTLKKLPIENFVMRTRYGRKIKPNSYSLAESSDEERVMSKHYKQAKQNSCASKIDGDTDFSASEISSSETLSSYEVEEKCLKRKCFLNKLHSHRKNYKKRIGHSVIVPLRQTPLKKIGNYLEQSWHRLQLSAIPKSLPCREKEYSDIYEFVKACLFAKTGGCMYISGVPGTGKTATVQEVLRNLEIKKEKREIPYFDCIEINGMRMADPYQSYVQIYKNLTGKTVSANQAAVILDKHFTEQNPKKHAVVLFVDELDHLTTRKQSVIYNIFDWPAKENSKLIVLAVANTVDLPERLMMSRISSRMGFTRKTFQPYTFKELQEIIMNRISEFKTFDPDAIQLVARKVAAVSGDARRALDICRTAADIALRHAKGQCIVQIEDVDTSLQQVFASPVVSIVCNLSFYEKLLLKSILAEFSRTGCEEGKLANIYKHFVVFCRLEDSDTPDLTSVIKISSRLINCHILLVDKLANASHAKIRLNVSSDDVSYALTL